MSADYWGCCGKMKPNHRTECQYYDQLPAPNDTSLVANLHQVGGEHYKNPVQHWDWVASNELDYFQGQITKYVARWKKKGGIQDLEKARHFLDKYIELQR